MLQTQFRVARLMAVVLLAMFAVSLSASFLPMDAQEPAKPQEKVSKLKELLEDRLTTAVEFERLVTVRVKNNEGTLEELMEANCLAHEAALELCDSDKARVAALENYLAKTKNTEAIGLRAAKTGQGRESAALKAKAERLRVEIALERVKAIIEAPKKGAALDPEPVVPAKVKTIPPKNGDEQKVSIQPGSIEAYESVRVSSQVPGVLKMLNVDIGDRVKRGQVLAVLHAPEMEAQVRLDTAAVDQARSRVAQGKACVSGAEADLETAKLTVKQIEATVKSAAAWVQFRTLHYQRMKALYDTKSIDEGVLDESKERQGAAVEAENAAKASVATAKAQVVAKMTKFEQARADVLVTEVGVKVAQANLEKSQVQLSFATITSPFDGVITQRGYSAGEFIRSTSNLPLATVQRIDLMRVVVQIPERDVPSIDVGSTAEVEIEALPGKKWSAKVSRTAFAEDPKTRTMRVELDLANPTGQIRPGMYAKVSIVLEK